MPLRSNASAPPRDLILPVLAKLNQLHPLPPALQEELIRCSFLTQIKKGHYLAHKDQYSKYILFIMKGLVSGEITFGSRKLTTFISVEGQFVSAIEGMYGRVPCSEDIKAEEDTVVLGIGTDELQTLFSEYIDLNILMRKVLEIYYQEAHRRSVFVRVGTAAEKYQYFLENFPDHIHRIPIEVAASFLNLKTVTLQRIIKKEQLKLQKKEPSGTFLSRKAILDHMTVFQPYLQKKLSLKQLATQLGISAHQLSHFLNVHFSENFNHFINRHRIEYILKRLSEKSDLEQYSLEGLGQIAGFSSKSTFFSEFKKYTGNTPSDYIYQHEEAVAMHHPSRIPESAKEKA